MNGGSILAMAGKECVAVAVDKRFGSGPQMVNIVPRHIWAPHSRVIVAYVGLEGDVQSLSQELKTLIASKIDRALGFGLEESLSSSSSASSSRFKSNKISPRALASITSHVLYQRRGYYVEPVIAGLMGTSSSSSRFKVSTSSSSQAEQVQTSPTNTPFLCAMDMIGAQSFSNSFVCSGAASKSLYGTAEAFWKPNMEPEQLVEVCGKAFQSALERDCLSGYGALIYLMTKDGIVEYDLESRND